MEIFRETAGQAAHERENDVAIRPFLRYIYDKTPADDLTGRIDALAASIKRPPAGNRGAAYTAIRNESLRLPQDINASPKSRTVVALFAFFLGGFGVHRFYVGKVGTGILQILCLMPM